MRQCRPKLNPARGRRSVGGGAENDNLGQYLPCPRSGAGSYIASVSCPAGAAAGLCFLRVSFFFLATRLFRILPDIRFRPNLVIVTSTWTTTQAQTMMGSEITMGSLGSKMWFSRKMLFLLQITWYGHVTQSKASAIHPLQKLWV